MFILDSGLKAGSINGTAGNIRKTKLDNILKVTASGNLATWNRMADGALVEADSAVYGITSSADAYVEIVNSSITDASVFPGFSSNYMNNTAANLPNQQYSLKCENVSLLGAEYNAGILRVGVTNAEHLQSEAYKYIVATGASNWGIGAYPLTDFRTARFTTVVNFGTLDNNGTFDKDSTGTASNRYPNISLRFIALPSSQAPVLSPMETDWGTITEPKSITLSLIGASSVTAKIDSGEEYALTPGTGNVVFDLTPKWESLSYGAHTVTIRSTLNGYQCGARITFTKSSSVVSVTTKPHVTAHRPTLCRVVSDVVVPTGAVLTQEVTNNANDESPVWETYTGTQHEFSNATKTAGSWGLAARITIDNSDGNANAEIRDSLAIGAIFEGGAE